MKKVLLSAAIYTLSFEMTYGMLERYDPYGGAITRCEDTHALVRANEGNGTIVPEEQINFRTVEPTLLLSKGVVSVLITEYFRTGDKMIQMGEPNEREYPLQRKLLMYEHNLSAGYSYPVEELFVYIGDIEFANISGHIVLEEEYVDTDNGIRHQKRLVNRYEMDDENLQARQLSEIFILTESGEQVIDEAKVREGTELISYKEERVVRTIEGSEVREGDDGFYYQRTETSEKWRRPDGTTFVKKTEDWERVDKPKLPAPVQAVPEVIEPSRQHSFWRRLFCCW